MEVAVKPTTRNGDKHMKNLDKYVGLDVHKDTTVIAVAEAGRTGEVRLYGTILSDLGALDGARSAKMAKPAAKRRVSRTGARKSGSEANKKCCASSAAIA